MQQRTYPPLAFWGLCGLVLPLAGMALFVAALFARIPYGLALLAVYALGIAAIVRLPSLRRLHEGRGWWIAIGVALATVAAGVEGTLLVLVAFIASCGGNCVS